MKNLAPEADKTHHLGLPSLQGSLLYSCSMNPACLFCNFIRFFMKKIMFRLNKFWRIKFDIRINRHSFDNLGQSRYEWILAQEKFSICSSVLDLTFNTSGGSRGGALWKRKETKEGGIACGASKTKRWQLVAQELDLPLSTVKHNAQILTINRPFYTQSMLAFSST